MKKVGCQHDSQADCACHRDDGEARGAASRCEVKHECGEEVAAHRNSEGHSQQRDATPPPSSEAKHLLLARLAQRVDSVGERDGAKYPAKKSPSRWAGSVHEGP